MSSALAVRSSSWLDHLSSRSHGGRLSAIGAQGGHALRQVGGGALAGALLGVVAGKKGTLDVKLNAKIPTVPVDLAMSVVGVGLGLMFAEHDYATDFRNAGTAGATVFAYRTVQRLVADSAKKAAVHGEDVPVGADDPILTAVQTLDK